MEVAPQWPEIHPFNPTHSMMMVMIVFIYELVFPLLSCTRIYGALGNNAL